MATYLPLSIPPSLARCDLSVLEPSGIADLRVVVRELSGYPPRVAPMVSTNLMRTSSLSDSEGDRHRRYASAALRSAVDELAGMQPDSGRNLAAFRVASRFGRWVHHGLLPGDRFAADILEACQRNGLVRDDGARSVLRTIKSGLDRSVNDQLPDLGVRRHA